MRQMDRYPFVIAVVLFLLAWMLGLPVRAQSAPLKDIHHTLIQGAGGGAMLYQDGAFGRRANPASTFKVPLAMRAAFLEDLPLK